VAAEGINAEAVGFIPGFHHFASRSTSNEMPGFA
jgi:hypothetical protein